jgi:hypothetical protein
MSTTTYHIQQRHVIGGFTFPWEYDGVGWANKATGLAALVATRKRAPGEFEYRLVRIIMDVIEPSPAPPSLETEQDQASGFG